jgi:hypothetical protein
MSWYQIDPIRGYNPSKIQKFLRNLPKSHQEQTDRCSAQMIEWEAAQRRKREDK